MGIKVRTLQHPMWVDFCEADLEKEELHNKREKHMNIIKDNKMLTFFSVRPGTTFEYKGKIYIKTKKDTAVNLDTGDVIEKDDAINMTSCTIYPRASIKLV